MAPGFARCRFLLKLALRNSVHGASIGAGTAIQARTGVDLVVVSPLRNGAHGAGIRAGTTADASITDHISHVKYTSIKLYLHFNTTFEKCNANF